MSREAFEAAAYECLSVLAGVETHDIDLRDHPEAWHAIEAFAAIAQADAYERAAKVCLDMANERPTTLRSERACSSRNQRAAQCHDAIRALAKEAGNA